MLRCYRENTLRTDVPYLLIRKMSLTRGTIQYHHIFQPPLLCLKTDWPVSLQLPFYIRTEHRILLRRILRLRRIASAINSSPPQALAHIANVMSLVNKPTSCCDPARKAFYFIERYFL